MDCMFKDKENLSTLCLSPFREAISKAFAPNERV